MPRNLHILAALAALAVLGPACATAPASPPPLPPAQTRLYDKAFPIVWDTVRVELNNDPRLEVDTIDKAGRFLAWDRTNNWLLLLAQRNVVTLTLESLGEKKTRMVLQISAEQYDTGGWTRPAGWYATPNVDEHRGIELAQNIDRRLGHTAGPADRVTIPAAPEAAPAPAPETTAPAARPAEPARTGWRRFVPRWPFRRSE